MSRNWLRRAVLVLALLTPGVPAASAAGLASGWVEGHSARVRLLAGMAAPDKGEPRLVAGIEIRMAPGWKTYWRVPGDGGGVPPRFDWSRSRNLRAAEVLYPAPRRLEDAAGDSIGYSGSVVFPVEVEASDPAKPVELNLALEYGICREICIPAEAQLALTVPAAASAGLPPEIAAGLARVPRAGVRPGPHDPRLERARLERADGGKKLIVEATFPGGAEGADLFLEGPDGMFVPLPVKAAVSGTLVRFEVDLEQASEPAALDGKRLRLTLVSAAGQAEAGWVVK